MRTYSIDLRERIVLARERGVGTAEVARLFKVSSRSIQRYCKQHRLSGHIQPQARGGYRKSRLSPYEKRVGKWIAQNNEISLREIQDRLAQEHGLIISMTALWHRIDRLGLTYKKNPARRRARPARSAKSAPGVAPKAKKLGGPKTGFP